MKNNISPETADKIIDFSMRIFKECDLSKGNIVVSPISVLYLLCLTAYGAGGDTRSQIEEAIGMPAVDLCETLKDYKNSRTRSVSCKFNIANAMLVSEDVFVNPDFAGFGETEHGIRIFRGNNVEVINKWAETYTYGMIPHILDVVPEDMALAMYNATAFMGEWNEPYEDEDIYDEEFTSADGTKNEVPMMHSLEDRYFENGDAAGVEKHYKGKDFDFIALLPSEYLQLEEYIRSLDGKALSLILSGFKRYEYVDTAIPVFSIDFKQKFTGILKNTGITDLFDPETADLSGIAEAKGRDLFISDIDQQAYIEVDKWGTKAAALTGGVFGCLPREEQNKDLYLNRPFMFMIVDHKDRIPIFMGAMQNL